MCTIIVRPRASLTFCNHAPARPLARRLSTGLGGAQERPEYVAKHSRGSVAAGLAAGKSFEQASLDASTFRATEEERRNARGGGGAGLASRASTLVGLSNGWTSRCFIFISFDTEMMPPALSCQGWGGVPNHSKRTCRAQRAARARIYLETMSCT